MASSSLFPGTTPAGCWRRACCVAGALSARGVWVERNNTALVAMGRAKTPTQRAAKIRFSAALKRALPSELLESACTNVSCGANESGTVADVSIDLRIQKTKPKDKRYYTKMPAYFSRTQMFQSEARVLLMCSSQKTVPRVSPSHDIGRYVQR